MPRTRSARFLYAAFAAWLTAVLAFHGSNQAQGRTEQHAPEVLVAYELYTRDRTERPTASWLAYTNPRSGEQRLLTPRPKRGEHRLDWEPVWSPNGERLAFWRTWRGSTLAEVYVINRDGTGMRRLLRTPKRGEVDPTILWTPDGKALVVAVGSSGQGRGRVPTRLPFLLIDVDSGRRTVRHAAVRQPRTMFFSLTPLDISPDSSEVLSLIYRCEDCSEPNFTSSLLSVSNLRTLESRVIAEIGAAEDAGRGTIAAWAPSGRRVAYLNGGNLTVISIQQGRARHFDLGGSLVDSGDDVSNLFWSPDGDEIFFGGRSITAIDLTTRRIRTVAGVVRAKSFEYVFAPILAIDRSGEHLAVIHGGTITVVATRGQIVGRLRLRSPSRGVHVGERAVAFGGD